MVAFQSWETTAGIIGAGIIGFFAYILGVYPVLTEALAIAVIAGTLDVSSIVS